MKKRIAVTWMLALFIFAALMYFATEVHFSTHNNLVHAQGPWMLTVSAAYESPSPSSGLFGDETNITASVTSPTPGGSGTQYIYTGWSGSGSVPASATASSVTFTINQTSSITWNCARAILECTRATELRMLKGEKGVEKRNET
jgi:hypothetical protein